MTKHNNEKPFFSISEFRGDNTEQIRKEFKIFHRNNPHVYREIKELATKVISRGRTHYGIGMLWEVARWEIWIRTRSNVEAEDFKMPNNFRAHYARMWLRDHPQHAGHYKPEDLQ